jgi:hypothetical protein
MVDPVDPAPEKWGGGRVTGERPDSYVVSFDVVVVFDTNNERTRYDMVGRQAICETCKAPLTVPYVSMEALEKHARTHEPLRRDRGR